jgi:hypothetical protein
VIGVRWIKRLWIGLDRALLKLQPLILNGGSQVIPVRMMPDLIMSIDSRSEGRYSHVPFRCGSIANESLELIQMNPQSMRE